MKTDIYKLAKNLGLGKKDVDGILSRSVSNATKSATVSADVYKAGTDYGTVSPKDVYKAGTIYGTISIKDS